MKKPLDILKHHVTGAIERGEKTPITSEPYEGWTNRETWNVALVIDNDEKLFNQMIDAYKNKPNPLVELLVVIIANFKRFDTDIREINFAELDEHYTQKSKEL